MKYKEIIDRRKELYELYKKDKLIKYDMEMDSIDHFFECETYKTYGYILSIAEQLGIKRVFDIGCAFGFQSEVFKNSKVEYIGVDIELINPWKPNEIKYIEGEYPFKINAKENDLAVSVLCLTWNCYLYEQDTLKKQCESLSRDFNNVLLYMCNDKIEFVSKHFKKTDILKHDEDYSYVLFKN